MQHTMRRTALMIVLGWMVAAGCRSTFRAGINHRDASTGGVEAGAEAAPDPAAADASAPGRDRREDQGPSGGDVRAADELGKDVEGEAGGQPRVPKLELLAGALGGSGNADGVGWDARFSGLSGLVTDGAGNLFVTDCCAVRKIDIATRTVTTVVGSYGKMDRYAYDTTNAVFDGPFAVIYDGAGMLLVSDTCAIRKVVIATGVVSTLAGALGVCDSSIDGTGTEARFRGPDGIVLDGEGNLFVADRAGHTIRKVVIGSGEVTTLAGSPGSSGSADGIGTDARFYYPGGITSDGAGNLFVADYYNHTIRQVIIATREVTTLAGSPGVSGHADGTGTAARLSYPNDVTSDGFGNLFVPDEDNQVIRKVVIATGEVSTIAGADGAATKLVRPTAIAADRAGNLFVADDGYAVRRVAIATGEVTNLAGARPRGGATAGSGAAMQLDWPVGIATDGAGNLFVADSESYAVRKVSIATGEVTTLAGSPTPMGMGSNDGRGTTAQFRTPYGLAMDGAGNLLVSDNFANTIRKITIATGDVTTLAGSAEFSGNPGGFADGMGTDARFHYPTGVPDPAPRRGIRG
jgi:sugar lactone lactonase YvrE